MNDQAALTLREEGDGVAWLVLDRPGSRVNLLDSAVLARLDSLLGEVEEVARAGRIRALVVCSGKDGSFIAGADVTEFTAIESAAQATAAASEAQRIFRRLELLPVPTLAAIDGACLGGGTELILACGHRLATERPETKIGLPEVRLGIIPGFGGTTRLPRLIGLRAALDLILTGKTVSASRARRIGLVDEAVPVAALHERARAVALDAAETGSRPRRRRSVADRLLDRTAPGQMLVLRQARKKVLDETGGHYPAPLAAIDVIRRSLGKPLDRAFEIEAAAVGRLIVGDVAQNLIHVFMLMEAAKKAAPPVEPAAVSSVVVLGAGVMGGGIAQLLAANDIGVRLKDIRAEALSQGLQHARKLFDRAVQRRRIEPRDAGRRMALIAPTLESTGFGQADAVIEAVVERMDVKTSVLRETESRVRAGCVIASNTSALSITQMQASLDRPADFCGMHFFNPVHRMPLVEVIRGGASGDRAIATVFALARRLGKTPIVVNDAPGFLVNRILGPYLNEAGWMLADGGSVEAIDAALVTFGMPMGPLRLLDEVGLDVARHAGRVLYEAFGERLRPATPLDALQTSGLLGRKGGAGFYRYEGDEAKGVNEEVYRLAGVTRDGGLRPERIRDRAVLPMINEAARLLEEGVVRGPGDVDLGMITGTGFPPFRGGLLRHADAVGLPRVVEKLEALRDEHGPRFEPAPLLRERARTGLGFYD